MPKKKHTEIYFFVYFVKPRPHYTIKCRRTNTCSAISATLLKASVVACVLKFSNARKVLEEVCIGTGRMEGYTIQRWTDMIVAVSLRWRLSRSLDGYVYDCLPGAGGWLEVDGRGRLDVAGQRGDVDGTTVGGGVRSARTSYNVTKLNACCMFNIQKKCPLNHEIGLKDDRFNLRLMSDDGSVHDWRQMDFGGHWSRVSGVGQRRRRPRGSDPRRRGPR